jgi:hypothetical protein
MTLSNVIFIQEIVTHLLGVETHVGVDAEFFNHGLLPDYRQITSKTMLTKLRASGE